MSWHHIAEADRTLSFPSGGRLVAVLGFSKRRERGLHPVCAARLAVASALAEQADAVVLSGSSRSPAGLSEAELMRRAWPLAGPPLVCDPTARTTAENAARVAALAHVLGAGEVVVVTSRAHGLRARTCFRTLLRRHGVHVSVAHADDHSRVRALVHELWAWPVLPFQLWRLGKDARSAPASGAERADPARPARRRPFGRGA